MSEKKDRRNFLGKLAIGSTALASASIFGAFASGQKEATIATSNQEEKKMKKVIKRVRALGFQWETLDPFLFCVHHEDKYPQGNDQMGPQASLSGRQLGNDFHIKDGWRMYHGRSVPGFPGHPHRGFETLTVVRKGMVDHSDSAGGAGRYGNGDLQWMTAGKGLMHAEMFPLLKKDEENPLELFQIWLNLPRASKMVEPDYKMLWSEQIPKFHHKDGVLVEVLAGSLFDKQSPEPPISSWAHAPENHVGVFNFRLEANVEFTLPKTGEGINRTLYVYAGSAVNIGESPIPEYHAVDVESDMDVTIQVGASPAKMLVLQGRPIAEPVVQHGPFVMNTRQEIQQAFEDYQRTQFGGWPWDRYDHVHDRNVGRFARYSNGEEEIPKG